MYGVALKSSLTYLGVTQGIHCGGPPVPAQAAHGAESKTTAPNQLQYAQRLNHTQLICLLKKPNQNQLHYVFKPTDTTRYVFKPKDTTRKTAKGTGSNWPLVPVMVTGRL